MKNIRDYFVYFVILVFSVLVFLSVFLSGKQFPTETEIETSDIFYHLRYLSDDSMEGRYPGTAGVEKVRRWILRFYEHLGLYPVFDGKYTMEFSFEGRYKKGEQNYLKLLNCQDSECVFPVEPLPLGETGKFQGKLLVVHSCQEDSQILNITGNQDVRSLQDFVVVCHIGGEMEGRKEISEGKKVSFESLYANLEKKGVSGIIFLQEGDQGKNYKIENTFFPKKGKPLSALLYRKEAAAVLQKLGNGASVEISVDYGREKLKGVVFAGALKPYQENQKVIYIGAHYDHLGYGVPQFSLGPMDEVYNGADDNASGVAGVLEVAEYFAGTWKKNPASVPEDWNIVFLLFDGEEWGLLGSDAFVNSKYMSQQAIAMINFDMIGRYRDTLQIQGKDTGDSVWQNLIETTVAGFTKKVPIKVQFSKGGIGPSDHTSFYRKNVSVLYFFTGVHEDYHKPTDDYRKINYEGMRDILHLSAELVKSIYSSPELPRFQKAQDQDPRRHQYKVRLGIIPKSYFSGEGIEVGGFVDGAPIAKSGIREGDIIIQIGEKQIRSIYDLMEFLSTARTGIRYTIHYKRGDQILTTQTELMGSAQ